MEESNNLRDPHSLKSRCARLINPNDTLSLPEELHYLIEIESFANKRMKRFCTRQMAFQGIQYMAEYNIASKPMLDYLISLAGQHAIDIQTKPTNNSPLHIATEKDNLEIAQILCWQGANIDLQNEAGDTPLHIAVGKQNLKFVNLLLEYKANTTLTNRFGKTPFALAFARNYYEIQTLLKKHTLNDMPSSP